MSPPSSGHKSGLISFVCTILPGLKRLCGLLLLPGQARDSPIKEAALGEREGGCLPDEKFQLIPVQASGYRGEDMHVADIGVVIMQRCRPGNMGFESLFKAFHDGSGQFLHIQIAPLVLKHRIRAQFKAVKIRTLGRSVDKLICLMTAHGASRPKEHAGLPLFVSARSRLDVVDICFGCLPLIFVAFDIIGIDNGHWPLGAPLPLLPRRALLLNNPALDL